MPAQNTSDAAIARIKAWAAANSWSKSRYAAEAGVVDTTLRHFHQADWNPTRETLAKLEAVIPRGWQDGDPLPKPKRRAA
jgi:ribosome-binding protein aMBF1 (putative translation factor)